MGPSFVCTFRVSNLSAPVHWRASKSICTDHMCTQQVSHISASEVCELSSGGSRRGGGSASFIEAQCCIKRVATTSTTFSAEKEQQVFVDVAEIDDEA